jgi:DNA repair protein RadC
MDADHHDRGTGQRARIGGVASLEDGDLVALVMGAREREHVIDQLLREAGGLDGLARAGPGRLSQLPGIGPAKAMRIAASVELGRRVQLRRAAPRLSLATPERVAAAFVPRIGGLDHEEMWVVSVDGRHRVRGARQVARGGTHSLAVTARDILSLALSDGASALLLVHNHPSGSPAPSQADVEMTRHVARAADVVGIPLLDHVVVVADGGYVSMLEEGMLDDVGDRR